MAISHRHSHGPGLHPPHRHRIDVSVSLSAFTAVCRGRGPCACAPGVPTPVAHTHVRMPYEFLFLVIDLLTLTECTSRSGSPSRYPKHPRSLASSKMDPSSRRPRACATQHHSGLRNVGHVTWHTHGGTDYKCFSL